MSKAKAVRRKHHPKYMLEPQHVKRTGYSDVSHLKLEDMPPYILMSPCASYMSYVLPDFLEAVKKIVPAPEKIVLCIALDHKYDLSDPMFEGVDIIWNDEIFVPEKNSPRIEKAKEIMRKYFLYGPEHWELCIHVDTDIILPPNIAFEMWKVMEETGALIACNSVAGRIKETKGCGEALIMMDRRTASMSRWFRAWFPDPKGHRGGTRGNFPEELIFPGKKFANVSHDMVFYAIFDQLQHYIYERLGRSGRVCDEFVEVEHRWRRPWWTDEHNALMDEQYESYAWARERQEEKKLERRQRYEESIREEDSTGTE